MTQSFFSLDHHLAELRQVGDDLRAARQVSDRNRSASPAKATADTTGARWFMTWFRPSRLAAS